MGAIVVAFLLSFLARPTVRVSTSGYDMAC